MKASMPTELFTGALNPEKQTNRTIGKPILIGKHYTTYAVNIVVT
ncbi:hypothetical protein [uncultured Methanobrevibacter sp.]|nr:hypothetical protein [uncultured Methanobrevibacter sp.]